MCSPRLFIYLFFLCLLFKNCEQLDKILSLNLSGYGPTPYDPVFQMFTVHSPGHLKIVVFYLCWRVHGFLERRPKYLPKLQLKMIAAYLECARVSQLDKPLFFAGQLMRLSNCSSPFLFP